MSKRCGVTPKRSQTLRTLVFNIGFDVQLKCKQQQITRKITPITSTYMLNDQQIDTTNTERDLGLCVSSNHTWKVEVRQQVSKAGKLLGYIRRNTMFVTDMTPRRSLYLALVRSHSGALWITDLGTTGDWSHQHVGKNSETRNKIHFKFAIFDRRGL
jgi:hypothetical protein